MRFVQDSDEKELASLEGPVALPLQLRMYQYRFSTTSLHRSDALSAAPAITRARGIVGATPARSFST